jgi:hypothetical protein
MTDYVNDIDKKILLFFFLISVTDGTDCQDRVCELRLGNYSRNDPTIIECVADNEKSTRISKVFNVDVYCKFNKNKSFLINFYKSFVLDPPKLITNVRTFSGSKSIDVFLQCSSIANPPASIIWLDNNKQEINNPDIYNIKIINQSSTLSFSIVRY